MSNGMAAEELRKELLRRAQEAERDWERVREAAELFGMAREDYVLRRVRISLASDPFVWCAADSC